MVQVRALPEFGMLRIESLFVRGNVLGGNDTFLGAEFFDEGVEVHTILQRLRVLIVQPKVW